MIYFRKQTFNSKTIISSKAHFLKYVGLEIFSLPKIVRKFLDYFFSAYFIQFVQVQELF